MQRGPVQLPEIRSSQVSLAPSLGNAPRSNKYSKLQLQSRVLKPVHFGSLASKPALPKQQLRKPLTNFDIYNVYHGDKGGIYLPSSISQSQHYNKGQLSEFLRQSQQQHASRNAVVQQRQMPVKSQAEREAKPIYMFSQKQNPQLSFSDYRQGENHFLIELVRKRQKEEILALIREEENKERERLIFLNNDNIMGHDREKLEQLFALERKEAQSKIEELMRRHEDQIGDLQYDPVKRSNSQYQRDGQP